MLNLTEFCVIVTAAAATGLGALLFLKRRPAPRPVQADDTADPLALLFEDGVLHHATDRAMQTLALYPGAHVWADLRESLLSRFPDFPETAGTGYKGTLVLAANDDAAPGHVQMSWRNEHCWVRFEPEAISDSTPSVPPDTSDIPALRRGMETTPNPMWEQDETGRVTWHNRAYISVYFKTQLAHPDPDRPLFVAQHGDARTRHAARNHDSGHVEWYEVVSTRIEGRTLYHATSITQLVEAEENQRKFVQTLSKTFAHLSIGLAIFDRNGQLALFNPALLDLTGLSPEFLSGKPKMLSFFDQLRENRRMPEPKNYRSWRQQITQLVAAAADDHYRETWSLEDGRTYDVQGRPHPEGATAFLIEDISAEVSLTRNFRAEQEMTQNLLDKIDEGFAVFSASGVLTFCNATYRDQWGQNPDAAFADVTVADCIDLWKGTAESDARWDQLAAFINGYDGARGVERLVTLPGGGVLSCRAERIGQGSTVVRFRHAALAPAEPG